MHIHSASRPRLGIAGHAVRRGGLRRRSRGAALVESAVVIPVFLILFASLVFVWKLYLAKVDAMKGARLAVWSYASSNCTAWADPSNISPGALFGLSHGSVSSGGIGSSADTSAVRNAGASAHVDMVNKTLGTAAVSAHSEVIAGSLVGGFTAPVSAKTSVMCNEPPYNGTLPAMVVAAFHEIVNW
jgi:hypothetical protein